MVCRMSDGNHGSASRRRELSSGAVVSREQSRGRRIEDRTGRQMRACRSQRTDQRTCEDSSASAKCKYCALEMQVSHFPIRPGTLSSRLLTGPLVLFLKPLLLYHFTLFIPVLNCIACTMSALSFLSTEPRSVDQHLLHAEHPPPSTCRLDIDCAVPARPLLHLGHISHFQVALCCELSISPCTRQLKKVHQSALGIAATNRRGNYTVTCLHPLLLHGMNTKHIPQTQTLKEEIRSSFQDACPYPRPVYMQCRRHSIYGRE